MVQWWSIRSRIRGLILTLACGCLSRPLAICLAGAGRLPYQDIALLAAVSSSGTKCGSRKTDLSKFGVRQVSTAHNFTHWCLSRPVTISLTGTSRLPHQYIALATTIGGSGVKCGGNKGDSAIFRIWQNSTVNNWINGAYIFSKNQWLTKWNL